MTEEPGTGAADYRDYYEWSETLTPCEDRNTGLWGDSVRPVLYSTVLLVGLSGNALVLWVLLRSRHRWSLTDVCFLGLSVSDLLFLSCLPARAHSDVDRWRFGPLACGSVTALFTTALYSGVFFSVLAALERYVIVFYERSICSRKWPVKAALALFVWTLSLFVSLPHIVFARVRENEHKKSCVTEFPEGAAWMSVLYLNVLSLVLPLMITGFCFCRILGKPEGKRSVVRLLLAVLALYFFFWTPYNIVTFLEFLQTEHYLVSCEWYGNLTLAKRCVETTALIHCCLKPIVYVCAGRTFRRRVLSLLPSFSGSPPSAESSSSELSSTLIT
ncbi:C-C chemokine receptor type 4-like isoform X2 [Puntigrus tetrazona]|uniref:C-C chemokine receptor type 4-like isoform X2 n=1 Tax=Puntigrus tetrazona TaxID=1606681 RepID=UPI001C89975E|nr:C-C chemokine receptor type 4-like isoform X2 [Puntigrus tetrazona]